jgi:hypothetical protein
MCPTGQDGDKKPPKEAPTADTVKCELCGHKLTPPKIDEYEKFNRRWSDKKDV